MPTRRRPKRKQSVTAESVVRRHFRPVSPDHLLAASRVFPVTARADLQAALEAAFGDHGSPTPVGVHAQYHHETLSIAHVLNTYQNPVVVGPLQYAEVDVGDDTPARCLKQALWLARGPHGPFAALLSPASRYGQDSGIHLEIVVPPGERGAALSSRFLDDVEARVRGGASYRGKVLSLQALDDYSGRVGAVKVHRLRTVRREDVILPPRTLELLESNVFDFIKHRPALHKLGLPLKKGLLFYGPPGTGKTHTVHYLAGRLPQHTTLVITAEQVGLLDVYFQLARFLQPAMIVIEDVDLIGRTREQMSGPCDESVLNKLLNEMDGLRADAELFFVLTTNRPDQLEAALASRPGRVDQAIEFPLPDDEGRRQLIRLYAGGLELSDTIVDGLVSRTQNASAAFIKELMRRSAQFSLSDGGSLRAEHVSQALEEMVFRGGSLNVRLLGGAAENAAQR